MSTVAPLLMLSYVLPPIWKFALVGVAAVPTENVPAPVNVSFVSVWAFELNPTRTAPPIWSVSPAPMLIVLAPVVVLSVWTVMPPPNVALAAERSSVPTTALPGASPNTSVLVGASSA